MAATQTATTSAAVSLGNGPHVIEASYPGDSNYASSTSAPLTFSGATQATTLTLSVNPSGTLAYGTSVTLTATLSPSAYQSHSSDGETITFYSGSTALGTGTLSNGVASLTISADSSMTVSATYAGDSYLTASSSSTQSWTVTPRTVTTLNVSASPSGTLVVGESVTLTATLSPDAASGHSTNGENITFYNGSFVIGTSTLSNGVATLPFTIPSVTATVTAQYGGDSYVAPSTSPALPLSAQIIATTLTVSAGPLPVRYNQTVTLSATVSPASSQGIQATGSVSFYAGPYFLETAYVQNGTASVTLDLAPVLVPVPGSYPLTAQYSGDATFAAGSAQAATPLTINPAATATSLTVSPNPALAGAPITLTATTIPQLGPRFGGGQTNFYDGITNLGGAVIDPTSGFTELTVSTLSPGTHTITAQFSGTGFEGVSTSSAVTLVIDPFTLTPSGGSGTPSQTVSPGGQATYSFTVTPFSGTTTTMPVAFSVSGLPNGATAMFSPASLPAGAGATTITMTVTVPASAAAHTPVIQTAAIPLAFAFLSLLPMFATRKRRLHLFCLLLLALPATISLSGCGSSSVSGGGNGDSGGTTPPPQQQTYNLTITATSASVTQSIAASLTVQ